MLKQYIDFVTSLFPSISPYTQEQAKKSINQFYETNKKFICFTNFNESFLAQGDIVTNIPFLLIDDDGEENEFITDGLIISNTCDIENDKNILIAPFFPIDEFSQYININSLQNNTIYRLVFFPDDKYSKKFADLSLISPFPKKKILEKINKKEIEKKYSLNTIGYYLLISKLTIHFLRPEDKYVQSLR